MGIIALCVVERLEAPLGAWNGRERPGEKMRLTPAQIFRISKASLMKVVNDLSQKGYLDTVRGRNGGIRLMSEPRRINIGQVVRDTEDRLNVIGCLEHKGYCPIERVCVLRGALRNATDAFLAVLDAHTLADLIKPQRALSSLLLDRSSDWPS